MEETETDDSEPTPQESVFENPLILSHILGYLHPSSLQSCRLVNKSWWNIATTSIQKSIKTRLLLCADSVCSANLRKFINVFQNVPKIPLTRATLILDHLPTRVKKEYGEREMELLLQLNDLFSSSKPRPTEHCSRLYADGHGHSHWSLFKDVPPKGKNVETVKAACDLISQNVDNLIINLSLHQGNPENIEYWLQNISFPNVTKLIFHITRPSSDDISSKSFQIFLFSLSHLKELCLRKSTNKGDKQLTSILLALTRKSNLSKFKNLSIEALVEDKLHLDVLIQGHLQLERLSLIYLGGEVSFVQKIEGIKRFLESVSNSLQHLYTHLPLFTLEQGQFPTLFKLKTLKIEKVCREYSRSQAELFGFDFARFFPKIQKITFKDYDLWKNMQLKSFPMEDVITCPEVKEISLPDLCFDAPLQERYLRKFPNLTKLSIIVSYVSRYHRQCSLCMVYGFLPHLRELHVSLLEIDVASCDIIFIGMTEETCKRVIKEAREPTEKDERNLSITKLMELETLKITSVHEKKLLGITDYSVRFGFLKMPTLRRLTIGSSLISKVGMAQLKEKIDVTIMSNIGSQHAATKRVPATVPETRDTDNG